MSLQGGLPTTSYGGGPRHLGIGTAPWVRTGFTTACQIWMALQPHLVCSSTATSKGYIACEFLNNEFQWCFIRIRPLCAQGLEVAMLDGTLWTELSKTINFLGKLQAHDPVYGGGWPVDELGRKMDIEFIIIFHYCLPGPRHPYKGSKREARASNCSPGTQRILNYISIKQ